MRVPADFPKSHDFGYDSGGLVAELARVPATSPKSHDFGYVIGEVCYDKSLSSLCPFFNRRVLSDCYTLTTNLVASREETRLSLRAVSRIEYLQAYQFSLACSRRGTPAEEVESNEGGSGPVSLENLRARVERAIAKLEQMPDSHNEDLAQAVTECLRRALHQSAPASGNSSYELLETL